MQPAAFRLELVRSRVERQASERDVRVAIIETSRLIVAQPRANICHKRVASGDSGGGARRRRRFVAMSMSGGVDRVVAARVRRRHRKHRPHNAQASDALAQLALVIRDTIRALEANQSGDICKKKRWSRV